MRKTKKILSILASMAMTINLLPCIYATAANEDVALIASDETSNWAMNFGWERSETAFKYHSDWTVENGLEITNNKAKFDELDKVKYPASSDDLSTKLDNPSGEYKFAYKTDIDGNPVAYDSEAAENANMWYHQGRNNFLSTFTVTGDDAADTRPLIVSFKYKFDTTNDQSWNMPWIYIGESYFYLNSTQVGIGSADSLISVANETCEHDAIIKFVPVDGKLKVDTVNIDGTNLTLPETAPTISAGKIEKLQARVFFASADCTHFVKNLRIYRGIPDVTVSSTTADGATGVDLAEGVTINFSGPVTLEDGAITLSKGGAAQEATVTPSADKKSATVTLAGYDAKTDYQINVDSSKVSSAIGAAVANNLTINFKTKKQEAALIASDKTSNWEMQWSWERYEAGWDYYADWTVENGLSITYNKAKYDELNAVAYPTKDEGATKSEASGEYKWAFKTDADGKAVAFDSAAAVNTNLWYHQRRNNFLSTFTVTGDNASDTRPLIVSFKYKFDSTSTQWDIPCIQIAGISFYANRTHIGVGPLTNGKPSKFVDVTNETYEHNAVIKFVPVDGVLKLDTVNIDGTNVTLSDTDVVSSAGNITKLSVILNKGSADLTHYVKDLEIYRGISDITVSSTTADNATDVDLEKGVTINFGGPVNLEKGAITLSKDGVAQAATVTPSADKKSAIVTLAEYDSKTAYRIKVDSTKVTSVLGADIEGDLTINFVTKKKNVEYEQSGNLFDLSKVTLGTDTLYEGARYTSLTKNTANNSFTVTVDNRSWTEAYNNKFQNANNKDIYGAYLDSNGKYQPIGGWQKGWGDDFARAKVNLGIPTTECNGKPIYVSFDYTVEGPARSFADFQLGDGRNRPYLTKLTVSNTGAYVSKTFWGSSNISGSEPTNKGHIEYALYPSEGMLVEGANVNGTLRDVYEAPQWAAFNGETKINKTTYAPYDPSDAAGSAYINEVSDYFISEVGVFIGRGGPAVNTSSGIKYDDTYTDFASLASLENSEITFSNIEVRIVNDFESVVNDDVIKADNPNMTLTFSDKVESTELVKLMVYQGVTPIENAISNTSISEDGLSATITLNTDVLTTSRYTLDVSNLVNAYNVASKTESIPFEYYAAGSVGNVSIKSASISGNDVKYTLSNNTDALQAGTLIIAAYADNDKLVGVKTADVSVADSANKTGTLAFDGDISTATKYKVMVWDSLSNMLPQSLSFDF